MGNRFQVVAKERRTIDGICFASLKEMKRYLVLKLMEKAGEIRDLKVQPGPYKCFINQIVVCSYTPDFEYIKTDTFELVTEELKSTGTRKDAAYRLRKKCFEAQYGRKVTEVIR